MTYWQGFFILPIVVVIFLPFGVDLELLQQSEGVGEIFGALFYILFPLWIAYSVGYRIGKDK